MMKKNMVKGLIGFGMLMAAMAGSCVYGYTTVEAPRYAVQQNVETSIFDEQKIDLKQIARKHILRVKAENKVKDLLKVKFYYNGTEEVTVEDNKDTIGTETKKEVVEATVVEEKKETQVKVEQPKHTHKYNAQVVAATTSAQGYTVHTCSCGASYTDSYTAKLPYYNSVNQTVYATTNVNVRKGPGTSYGKLGSLSNGQAVTRIGVGDNGWSKITYNGQEAYVSSSYLTTTKPASKPVSTPTTQPVFDGSTPNSSIAARMAANSDLLGVMYIPSIGMSPVDVYISRNGQDLQTLANKKNGAYAVGIRALNDFYTKRLEIGDHNTENFNKNTQITTGTVAYINRGDKVVRLRCISTIKQGSISEYDASIYNDHGVIATLCCAPGGTRTINRWVVTGDSDMSFAELYGIATQHYEGYRN